MNQIQRGAGECLAAKISYNLRAKIYDERTGTTYDNSEDSADILGAPIVVGMTGTPEQIAAKLEAREKHPRAVVGIDMEGAIPWQLRDRTAKVVRRFAEEYHAEFGLPIIAGVHTPPKKKKRGKSVSGDAKNYHFHAVSGLRQVDGAGNLAKNKCTAWDAAHWQKEGEVNALAWCRQRLCEILNDELERAGYPEVRWDHRSHAARGIEDEPTIHQGQAATYAERSGEKTKRGERNRKIRERNAARKAAKTNTAAPKTAEKQEKISAAVAARPPAAETVTKPVTKPTTVPPTVAPNPSLSATPTATKPSRQKLTHHNRERILDRLHEVPALADGFVSRHRSRSRQVDERKRVAGSTATDRKQRSSEAELRERETLRREQRLALATGATQSAIQRTRRARGAKRDADRLAAKAAARKVTPKTAADIQQRAEAIKQTAAERIAEVAPQVTVLSLFDQLGKGPRSR